MLAIFVANYRASAQHLAASTASLSLAGPTLFLKLANLLSSVRRRWLPLGHVAWRHQRGGALRQQPRQQLQQPVVPRPGSLRVGRPLLSLERHS